MPVPNSPLPFEPHVQTVPSLFNAMAVGFATRDGRAHPDRPLTWTGVLVVVGRYRRPIDPPSSIPRPDTAAVALQCQTVPGRAGEWPPRWTGRPRAPVGPSGVVVVPVTQLAVVVVSPGPDGAVALQRQAVILSLGDGHHLQQIATSHQNQEPAPGWRVWARSCPTGPGYWLPKPRRCHRSSTPSHESRRWQWPPRQTDRRPLN